MGVLTQAREGCVTWVVMGEAMAMRMRSCVLKLTARAFDKPGGER